MVVTKKSISEETLIYWIDKEFVQNKTKELFNSELSEEELLNVKKAIEWGLSFCVFDIIDNAIKESQSIEITN